MLLVLLVHDLATLADTSLLGEPELCEPSYRGPRVLAELGISGKVRDEDVEEGDEERGCEDEGDDSRLEDVVDGSCDKVGHAGLSLARRASRSESTRWGIRGSSGGQRVTGRVRRASATSKGEECKKEPLVQFARGSVGSSASSSRLIRSLVSAAMRAEARDPRQAFGHYHDITLSLYSSFVVLGARNTRARLPTGGGEGESGSSVQRKSPVRTRPTSQQLERLRAGNARPPNSQERRDKPVVSERGVGMWSRCNNSLRLLPER